MTHTIGPIEKLGTQWWFEFFDLPEDTLRYVESSIAQVINEFEDRYSRFCDDSWLSQLNHHREFANPDIEFVQLCEIALQAYQHTNGVFNIAVAHTLENRGYDAQYSFGGQNKKEKAMTDLVEILKIGSDRIYLAGDAKLDFGGFGKGFMIDTLAQIFQYELGINHFIINGGGDIYATCNAQGKAIDIILQHPENRDTQLGIAQLYNQAFAASSPHVRSWQNAQGETQHHLVGSNTQPHSSFVITTTATWADIYATTLAINPDYKPPTNVWSKTLMQL